MNTQDQDFSRLLQKQQNELQQLSEVINQEREAIIHNDLDTLGQLLEQKLRVSEELTHTEQALQRKLGSLGLSLDPQGMESYIDTISEPGQKNRTSALWRENRELASDCRRNNAVNGRIIEANRKAAEEMLRILKGQKADDRNLYDPNGQQVTVAASNSLAKA